MFSSQTGQRGLKPGERVGDAAYVLYEGLSRGDQPGHGQGHSQPVIAVAVDGGTPPFDKLRTPQRCGPMDDKAAGAGFDLGPEAA